MNGSLAVALPLTVNESTQQLQAQAGLTVAGVYKLQACLALACQMSSLHTHIACLPSTRCLCL